MSCTDAINSAEAFWLLSDGCVPKGAVESNICYLAFHNVLFYQSCSNQLLCGGPYPGLLSRRMIFRPYNKTLEAQS